MGLPDGVYRIGPESGRLLVRTARTGLGAKAGHDLTIEATRWQGEVTVAGDASNAAISLDVEVDSLEVREGTGGVKRLTDSDRGDIQKTMRQKILRTDRYPSITFRSTRVEGTPEAVTVTGDLTIVGRTNPVTAHGRLDDGHLHGTATVVQTRWGIKPYTGFFGALKLRDEVEIELTATLAP